MTDTWKTSLVAMAVVVIALTSLCHALPGVFEPKQVLMAPKPASESLSPNMSFEEKCQSLCKGPTRFACPRPCRRSGLYSFKRNYVGFYDLDSMERDRAQSLDDKMFMELLGRKYGMK